jgi:KaiC/GvpD/RAD55 family RecA-like ATPase
VTPVASLSTLLFKKRNNEIRWNEPELDRVSSGIDGLDPLIQGGFISSSSTLLYGPPGNGKRPFCLQFLAEGLRLGDSEVMVVSNESVQDAIESFEDLGCSLSGSTAGGKYDLEFVDCYSWRIEEVPYPKMSGNVVKSSMDINHVSLAVAKAIEELKPNKSVRITLDLLSPLLMTASPQSVYRLGELLTAELKKKGATSMFMLTEGMHDQQTVASLQQLLDNVILFRTADKAGVLRKEVCVTKMKRASFEPRWIPISKDLKTGRLSIRQE